MDHRWSCHYQSRWGAGSPASPCDHRQLQRCLPNMGMPNRMGMHCHARRPPRARPRCCGHPQARLGLQSGTHMHTSVRRPRQNGHIDAAERARQDTRHRATSVCPPWGSPPHRPAGAAAAAAAPCKGAAAAKWYMPPTPPPNPSSSHSSISSPSPGSMLGCSMSPPESKDEAMMRSRQPWAWAWPHVHASCIITRDGCARMRMWQGVEPRPSAPPVWHSANTNSTTAVLPTCQQPLLGVLAHQ